MKYLIVSTVDHVGQLFLENVEFDCKNVEITHGTYYGETPLEAINECKAALKHDYRDTTDEPETLFDSLDFNAYQLTD